MLTVNLDKASKNLGHDAGGRTDYKVFTCLTEYMDGNGVSTVPQNIIAEETGFARRTVSNSIHRLQDKSFLTIEKTIKNNTGIAGNIYHINHRYLLETKPVEHSQTKTRFRVQETQKTAPGCVNLEEALAELGSDGVNGKAKKIFTLIARHANQNGEARLPMLEITDATHMSAKSVNNEIGFLIHNGFLTVSKEFVNTSSAHYYRNVYTIDSRFLHPMPAACYQGGPHVVPDYLSGWKLVTDDGEHEGVSYASQTTINPRLSTGDVRRLARLGEVLDDVVHKLLNLYEEKNK